MNDCGRPANVLLQLCRRRVGCSGGRHPQRRRRPILGGLQLMLQLLAWTKKLQMYFSWPGSSCNWRRQRRWSGTTNGLRLILQLPCMDYKLHLTELARPQLLPACAGAGAPSSVACKHISC